MRCQRHSRPPDPGCPELVDSEAQRCMSRLRVSPQPIRRHEDMVNRRCRNHCCCQREMDRDGNVVFARKPSACVILPQPSRPTHGGQVKHSCGRCPELVCLKHCVGKSGPDAMDIGDLQRTSCQKPVGDRCHFGKQRNYTDCVASPAWGEQSKDVAAPDNGRESCSAKPVTYCPPWSFDPVSNNGDLCSYKVGAASSDCESCQDEIGDGKPPVRSHLTSEQGSSPPVAFEQVANENSVQAQQQQYDCPWDRLCGQIDGMQIKDLPVSYDGAWDCPPAVATHRHGLETTSAVAEISPVLHQKMDANVTIDDSSASIEDSGWQDCKFAHQKQIDGIPSWWHGDITRQQARELLSAPGRQPGDYLVRTSQSGGHSLSMLTANNDVVHLKISHYPHKPAGSPAAGKISMRQYILGMCSKPFNSISSIIQYYSTHPVPIRGSASYICLRRPVFAQHN